MKTVLITEDELILGMINQHLIESLGYQAIDTVTTGREAIRAVKGSAPDVILMDIVLDGDLDGIGAMKEIRKFTDTPVIFITGNSDEKIHKLASEIPNSAFVTKPIDANLLRSALEKILQ